MMYFEFMKKNYLERKILKYFKIVLKKNILANRYIKTIKTL